MAMPLHHADDVDNSFLVGHNVRRAADLGFISSAQVVAATNTTDLKTACDAASCHADEEGWKHQVDVALDIGNALGDFSDANVQAATTIETLVDNTEAGNDDKRGEMTIE